MLLFFQIRSPNKKFKADKNFCANFARWAKPFLRFNSLLCGQAAGLLFFGNYKLIRIEIEYRQICVFNSKLKNPYNDWSEKSVNQGFAYRKGSVSFDTEHDGCFDLYLNEKINKTNEIIREFELPFSAKNEIEIGSIINTIKIKNNNYKSINFKLYENNQIEITFLDNKTKPRIIKTNKKLDKLKLFLKEKPAK